MASEPVGSRLIVSPHGAAVLALCIVLLAAGCGGNSSSSPSPKATPVSNGSFAPAASTPTMNHARTGATATLLLNGKVLIVGGSDSTSGLASVELYDPATNTFAPAASLPRMNQARSDVTAALLFSGKVLIAGGDDTIELYDPATNTFAPAASLPTMNTVREDPVAALLPDGKVLIAGGENFMGPLESVDLYNPTTNSFAPPASTPTMNGPHFGATATSLSDGRVFIEGGEVPITSTIVAILSGVDLYAPVTNTCAPPASIPTMNTGRINAAAALLSDGKVLIAGGTGNGTPHFTVTNNSVDLYDPASNSFAPFASTPLMNQPRDSPTATRLPNGKVLIAGGDILVDTVGGNSFFILASVDLYDPATNSFAPATSIPTMNNGRFGAAATLLPNGKVLIAGGEGASGPTNTVELYTP